MFLSDARSKKIISRTIYDFSESECERGRLESFLQCLNMMDDITKLLLCSLRLTHDYVNQKASLKLRARARGGSSLTKTL